ncbi:hypothetical protein D9M73_209120 [compost metagenome]
MAGDRRIDTRTGGSIKDRQTPHRSAVRGGANTGGLRLVSELQALDARQAIDAITPGHQVGHDDGVAFDSDRVLRRIA